MLTIHNVCAKFRNPKTGEEVYHSVSDFHETGNPVEDDGDLEIELELVGEDLFTFNGKEWIKL